jgi:hypothetical protein
MFSLSNRHGSGAVAFISTMPFRLCPEYFEYLSVLSTAHSEGTGKSYPSPFELPGSMHFVVYPLLENCILQQNSDLALTRIERFTIG